MERGEKQRKERGLLGVRSRNICRALWACLKLHLLERGKEESTASMSFDGVSGLKIGMLSVEVSEKSMTRRFQKNAFYERVNGYVIFS